MADTSPPPLSFCFFYRNKIPFCSVGQQTLLHTVLVAKSQLRESEEMTDKTIAAP